MDEIKEVMGFFAYNREDPSQITEEDVEEIVLKIELIESRTHRNLIVNDFPEALKRAARYLSEQGELTRDEHRILMECVHVCQNLEDIELTNRFIHESNQHELLRLTEEIELGLDLVEGEL